MKIGFVTAYSSKHPAGLERATLDLLKALVQNTGGHEIVVYTKQGSGLASLLPRTEQFRVHEVRGGRFWKDIGLFFAPKSDIYIFNGHQVPLLFKPKRSAVIMYDFAYRKLGNPRSHTARVMDFYARVAFRRAKRILAISEATKQDVINLFKISEKKVGVLPLGYTDLTAYAPEPIELPQAPFFFFVGTIKKRKNVHRVVEAYVRFKKEQPGYKLVIAGKYDPESDYFRSLNTTIRNASADRDVVFLGHVTDSALAYIYSKNPIALVYPSLLEGFGLPVLEAMHCGVPVITSNTSSLPEVGQGVAYLVSPEDASEIANAMSKVVQLEGAELQALREKGHARAGEFSWKKTAKSLIDSVDKLA